jgi:hypothetical protein
MSLGPPAWSALRRALSRALSAEHGDERFRQHLTPMARARAHAARAHRQLHRFLRFGRHVRFERDVEAAIPVDADIVRDGLLDGRTNDCPPHQQRLQLGDLRSYWIGHRFRAGEIELGQPRGSDPIALPSGEKRGFIKDGDETIFRGFCDKPGNPRIGFDECRAVILPAG